MIDPQTEALQTLNQARRLPWMRGRFGNDVALCTMLRWIKGGVGGVKLDAIKIGGTLFTSEQATLRFIDALNAHSQESHGPRNSARRSNEIAMAAKALDAAGI